MNYTVQILRRAQRAMAALPPPDFERVRDAVFALADDPRPSGCAKLTAREAWRIRVGQYRVIYEIDDPNRIVTVLDVGHRREVYR